MDMINAKYNFGYSVHTIREGLQGGSEMGYKIVIDSCGELTEKLAADGIDAEVISICTIKPLDEDSIIHSAKKTGKVVTVEEHSVIGGLGSAVCDALCAKLPTPVKKIGMQDVFGESGPAAALIEKYGLDAKGVCKSVKEFIGK